MARVSTALGGTLIQYATSPGNVANDGQGENGSYTSALLRLIDTPDMTVEAMMKEVAISVADSSNKRQIPWQEGSLLSNFYFKSNLIFPGDTQLSRIDSKNEKTKEKIKQPDETILKETLKNMTR